MPNFPGEELQIGGDKGAELTKKAVQMFTENLDPIAGEKEASGREYMFTKYPNDFEYYAIAFELINSLNRVADFFSFPVMPENMRISSHPMNTVRKTMSGTVVSNNPTFISSDIKLQGNFGRKFKRLKVDSIITGDAGPTVGEAGKAITEETVTVGQEFDREWKTGYGCTKILEALLKKVSQLDPNGGAYRLFFYNLAFNESHLVEVMDFDFNINKDLNRIWSYDISLKTLGPAISFNKNTLNTRKQLLQINKIINNGNNIAIKGETALKSKKGFAGNTKLQKLLNTEVGKRAYQLGTAYTPNILRTGLQIAEAPTREGSLNFLPTNAGNNIFNTGYIF
jgi:hypothetical protein